MNRRPMRCSSAALVAAIGVLCFLCTSCWPIRNSKTYPITTAYRSPAAPTVPSLMVLGIKAKQIRIGYQGMEITSFDGFDDPYVGEFTSALRSTGLARRIVASPIANAGLKEAFHSAARLGIPYLLTTKVVGFDVDFGSNGNMVWCVLFGIVLLPALPFFLLVPDNKTLKATAKLELSLYSVADRQRIWSQVVRGVGWKTLSSSTLMRRGAQSGMPALNAAYRRAVPLAIRALQRWARPPAAPLAPPPAP